MKAVEACSKMAQSEVLFGSTPTERPLIQELFTTRYEELDAGFNERDYATASKGDSIENLQLSETRAYEIDLERKKATLFNSRSGHMGNLTKIRNRLMDLIKEDGARQDVLNGCRQFVNVHENYLQLLRKYYGGDACLLDKAVKSYDEQKERKLNLDFSVKLWLEKSESGRVGIEGNRGVVSEKVSKDGRSEVSRSSSRLSSVSKKREKLALAQLNLHRLKLKQLLDEEERAIRAKKELLEAEMEAKKAAVSLKIYEDDLNERKTEINEDLLPYLCPS